MGKNKDIREQIAGHELKQTEMSLASLQVLLQEVLTDGSMEYQAILEKLLRAKPGTERHRSLLCDLSVAASWTEIKAETAQEAIDEYLNSLPDED
ncbi:MAG: hypothetical protein ACRD2B_17580 [Terriglobia bacterium]